MYLHYVLCACYFVSGSICVLLQKRARVSRFVWPLCQLAFKQRTRKRLMFCLYCNTSDSQFHRLQASVPRWCLMSIISVPCSSPSVIFYRGWYKNDDRKLVAVKLTVVYDIVTRHCWLQVGLLYTSVFQFAIRFDSIHNEIRIDSFSKKADRSILTVCTLYRLYAGITHSIGLLLHNSVRTAARRRRRITAADTSAPHQTSVSCL